MTRFSEAQFRVTLTVDGVNYGTWDKKTGGKSGSNTGAFPPGGLGDPEVISGPKVVDQLTLNRAYRPTDHDNAAALLAAVGKGQCVVKQLPLDADGNAYGSPIVWNGLLASVQIPDHDSTSSNPAMLEVMIQTGGAPTA